MSHRIRLARPWALIDGSDRRISVERRFHRPSGLAADQPVDLVVRCQPDVRLDAAAVNGCRFPPEEMSSDSFWRQSVAEKLESSNLLRLDFTNCAEDSHSASAGDQPLSENPALSQTRLNPDRFDLSSWAEVWLEIGES